MNAISKLLARKFGLTAEEVARLIRHPKHEAIVLKVESWRVEQGAASNSPLARGYLNDLVSGRERL